MISWTAPIGSAYSSLPSENTTSCCEVMSDMSSSASAGRGAALEASEVLLSRREAHDEARAAAVERRLERARVPWWLSATARTIERPRPDEPERSPCAAEEALEDLVVQLGRDARARRPRPRARRAPLTRSTLASTAVPGSVWRSAFSIRFSTSRCSSSRAPSISSAAAARRSRSRGRRPPARARTPRRSRRSRGRPARCGGSRPASARASSSRSATRRRIRREERSAEAAASRCSPCSVSSSSSRLASTDVSGVRSSCEASATNSRWRASVASVSARASSSACSIDSSVVGELGDLVVGLRARDRAAPGRACARSRARRRSARRSAPSRGARWPGRRAARARRRRARRGRGTASRGWPSPARRRSRRAYWT